MNTKLYCPFDGRPIGKVPFQMVWTGALPDMPEPEVPDEPDPLHYLPCETCRKQGRPHWSRWEVVPPNPPVVIVVRVNTERKEKSA